MKKFLIISAMILSCLAGVYFVIFNTGIYFGFLRRAELKTVYYTDGGRFVSPSDPDHPITIRGTEISSFVPGYHFSDYAADKEDYLRWLELIADMGANTVMVPMIMDDDFYNAFYSFNESRPDGELYLLQGISFPDEISSEPLTAYESGLMSELIKQGKTAVDVIHGRRDISSSSISGGGIYRKDVSPYVIGITVSGGLTPDDIAFTDHSFLHSGVYDGEYVSASGDSSSYEAMLAQVLDEIASYEAGKYRTLRPVGAALDPLCDFLEYEEIYARQLGKYASIDTNNITAGGGASVFTAYSLSDTVDGFTKYLSADTTEELGGLLEELDTDQLFSGYCQLLAEYNETPVIGIYSASSARAPSVMGQTPMTEAEQGLALAEVSSHLESVGWAGGIIAEWQDVWTRRSWNTSFATLADYTILWHDLNTPTQNLGLMAFEPGKEDVCVIDGDVSEWAGVPALSGDGIHTVKAAYDAEGLYLMVDGIDTVHGEALVIPLDISPETGSETLDGYGPRFGGGVDFALLLYGAYDTRLFVNQRYDAHRENFLYETEGIDPFVERIPDDTNAFVPVYLALGNETLTDSLSAQSRLLQRLGVYEAGMLVHGVGDPESPSYNSLADFCYGDGAVEIRLPWLLINVGDPPNMQVHRDYYQHYGVEFLPVRNIGVGIGSPNDAEISLGSFRVRGWESGLKYRERTKQSYDIIKKLWRGDNGDEVGG